MRKLLLVSALSVLVASTSIADGVGNFSSERNIGGSATINYPLKGKNEKTTFITKLNGKEISPEMIKAEKARRNAQRSDETVYYTVTPNIIKDSTLSIRPGLQFAIPVGGPIEEGWLLYSCFIMEMGEDVMVFPWNLPAGKFDFITMTSAENGIHCVIKEGVEVNEDMTIDFDMDEATNHIVFDPRLPDGETPMPWMNWETLEEAAPGNCCTAGQTLNIYHKNGHNVMTYLCNIGLQKFDENGNYSDSRHSYDVWTNNTTEFAFFQIFSAAKQSGESYIIPMFANGCKTQTATNDYTDYQKITSTFSPSLFDPSSIPDDGTIYAGIAYGFSTYINNHWTGYEYSTCFGKSAPSFTAHLCIPKTEGEIIKSCDLFPLNAYIQNANSVGIYGIFAPPAGFSNGEWQYQTFFTPQFEGSTSMSDFAISVKEDKYAYKSYDQYAMAPNYNPVFGESCPITLFIKPVRDISYDFIGRFGENRSIDLLNHKLTIKQDGKVVCDSWEKLQEMIQNWQVPESWSNFATWDYEITNENMMVDGLQGMNKCYVHLEEKDQFSAPTVTHLQMRDATGTLTDKFKTAEGSIYFSAGVWSTWELIYTDIKEAKISYRPYQAEDWIEMDLNLKGNEPFLPAYGLLYEADASQIQQKSETGWYDLKIEIYDGNGNSQIQEVSPAIKIESLSGVEDIDAEFLLSSSAQNMEIFNLNGMRVNNKDILIPGIYVVKKNGETYKVKI